MIRLRRAALVPRILARGTERLPTLRDVQIELDRLYGAGLSGDTRKAGERQLVQFRADWITDKLAGAPLLDAMGDLVADYVHAPARAADGSLRAGLIEQERKMMADEAAAVFDDKGRYARHRLLEIMCRDEAYARPSIGRLAEIQAVTPAAVESAHADLVERAPADLFLVGDLTWAQAKSFGKKLGLHRGRRPRRLKRTARRGRRPAAHRDRAAGGRPGEARDGLPHVGHAGEPALSRPRHHERAVRRPADRQAVSRWCARRRRSATPSTR